MESYLDEKILFVHLHPDENVLDALCHQSKKFDIQTGIILSGIGQVKNITLGYFKEKGDYQEQIFSGPYELLSLSGSIIKQNNSYIPHIHCTIGDIKKNVFGGHLINATVEVTNEIVLLKTNIKSSREISQQTGLMELSFNN